ncbi:hypothetical protein DY000_02006921 [Brassica cretica]|uniref:Uncharacterized protein n=1 Tax=Brassica cretica TaxID=69181 RepID=A0ABQ7C2G2_BRACR|nr:hypothetical protein DY000_02006921 [Brassica cretica]
MKAPNSFRNPGLWCDFHRNHNHKTEDCIALRIEVNEQLKKGHLRDLLFEKPKSHLYKERTKPCGREEENLERQARPRGSQAKTPAPGYGRNNFHGQGARKGPSPTS